MNQMRKARNTVTFLVLLLLPGTSVFSQQKDDRTIVLSFVDSVIARQAIKRALVTNDYIIKEPDKPDTLVTYPREMKKMAGYASLVAVLKGNVDELTGYYGSKKLNYFGADLQPSSYIQIRYYAASKSWKEMMMVANTTGGEITFSK